MSILPIINRHATLIAERRADRDRALTPEARLGADAALLDAIDAAFDEVHGFRGFAGPLFGDVIGLDADESHAAQRRLDARRAA